jgi:hypothetical protein
VPRDGNGEQLHASGASTPTPERDDGIGREHPPPPLPEPTPSILIAPHEREHEEKVPSNAPDEQPGHDAPDLYTAERGSEVRNRGECEDQGTVAEQPPESPYTKPTLGSTFDSCTLRIVFLPFKPDLVDDPMNKALQIFTRAPHTASSCTQTPKAASRHYSPIQRTSPSANGIFRHLNLSGSFTTSIWAVF